MRRKYFTIGLAAFLIVVVGVAWSWRDDFAKVPRVPVGPLVTEIAGSTKLRLFAVGDTGSGDQNQFAVAAAMEARCQAVGGIDGLLLLGDNAYPAGVTSVDDPQWQTKVIGPYNRDCLSAAPIYPVLGNHDYRGTPAAQIEYSRVNPRWRMPNRFYAVHFGRLLNLVAFDSQVSDFCFNSEFCSLDFLFEQIAQENNAAFAWTVVTAHHPMASSSTHSFGHGGGWRKVALQPFVCQRIDAWIAGHAHELEHRVPDCRMELFVAGGGGATLYDIEPSALEAAGGSGEIRYVESRYGFLELEVDATSLKSKFIGTEGQTLHASEKLKPSGA